MPTPFLSSEEYDERAHALYNEGQYDEALQCLRKADKYLSQAEKLNPGLSRNAKRKGEILQEEAEVYVARKKWEQAIPAFAGLISVFENQRKRDPKNDIFLASQPGQYARLADCYEGAGQRDSAIRAIRRS